MRIIAELCQNHRGDIDTLEEMVREAAKFADIIKIQTILADSLTYREEYEEHRPFEKEYLRLKDLELSEETELNFINLCRELGVEPMTSLFSKKQIDRFNRLGYRKLKLSGYALPEFNYGEDLVNLNFDELIFSTSSLTLEEIEKTISNLEKLNINFTMLQCTCIYPTPADKLNLYNIYFYKTYFDLPEVGFSDHTNPHTDTLFSTKQAIFQGANTIERHFTILPIEKTRDGKVSINVDMGLEIKRFGELTKKQQYFELNKFNDKQVFNHDYYRGRFK